MSPTLIAYGVAQLSALGAALVGVYYFRDHRAIVASFLTEAVVYAILSHALGRSAYRVWPSGPMFRTVTRFGLPLLLNGIGLAMIAQLDRVLVGSWLGVETLGNYAVIFSLALYPMAFFARVIGPLASASLMTEQTASARNDLYSSLLFVSEVASVGYVLFLALTLDWLVPLIFGPAFHVSPPIHVLIVLIAFLRLLRGGSPTSFLLVERKTKELAVLNVTSGIGIIFAIGFVHYQPNVTSVLFGLLIGEGLADTLLFSMSSARPAGTNCAWQLDLIMSLVTVGIIVGTLAVEF